MLTRRPWREGISKVGELSWFDFALLYFGKARYGFLVIFQDMQS